VTESLHDLAWCSWTAHQTALAPETWLCSGPGVEGGSGNKSVAGKADVSKV
jgi:hypothetical protein